MAATRSSGRSRALPPLAWAARLRFRCWSASPSVRSARPWGCLEPCSRPTGRASSVRDALIPRPVLPCCRQQGGGTVAVMVGRSTVLIAAVLATAAPASAQSAGTVDPVKFPAAPLIDGRLDDEVWSRAARISDFRQVQPGDNAAPSQSTELLIGYDRRALYLAFRAADPSGRI